MSVALPISNRDREIIIAETVESHAQRIGATEDTVKGASIYARALFKRGHSAFYAIDKAKAWTKLIVESEK